MTALVQCDSIHSIPITALSSYTLKRSTPYATVSFFERQLFLYPVQVRHRYSDFAVLATALQV